MGNSEAIQHCEVDVGMNETFQLNLYILGEGSGSEDLPCAILGLECFGTIGQVLTKLDLVA